MRNYYIQVTEEFAKQYENYEVDDCKINFVTTTDGRIVTSVNTANDFPDLFDDSMQIVRLDSEKDFPKTKEDLDKEEELKKQTTKPI